MAQENATRQDQNQASPAQTDKTPLEMVKEQKAAQQQNREVTEQRVDHSAEVPGQSVPSDRRHHPQRQLG